MYKIQHSTFYSKTEICTHLLPRKSNKWKNPYLLLAWTTPSRQTTPILVNKKKKKKHHHSSFHTAPKLSLFYN